MLSLFALDSIILVGGCSNKITNTTVSNTIINTSKVIEVDGKEDNLEEFEDEKVIVSVNEVEEKEEWITPKYITYVEIVNDTNIYSDMNETSIIGDVKRYDKLFKTNTYYADYYEIAYDSDVAYIKKSDSKVIVELEYPTSITRLVKLDKGSNIYYDPELTELLATYDDIEVGEVYQEMDNVYSIKTNDFYGYINKDEVSIIPDKTLVVVDISDQLLKLYRNNEIILESPVVTGKPSTPTHIGEFNVFRKTGSRYLIGDNYKYYVNTMMNFDNGIGLHDAEYHTDSDGMKHGSRNYSEFGGKTYLTNGSHGCVNMPHDEAMFTAQYVDVGTKVIVKQ